MYGALATIDVPSLVRIKPGALDRLGVYCTRAGWSHVVLVRSAGLPEALVERARRALADIDVALDSIEDEPSLAAAARLLAALPGRARAVIALGGGRAVDLAKHAASIAGLPFVAVPTSLSHDGFASPLASLHTPHGRRSIACRPPAAVIVDTAVCLEAPAPLWLSGVGDVVAKVSAVFDWKLAFHALGEPVNDLAALLSDATVSQLSARPVRDLEGTRALGTALLLNGVAMALAGTSRPASGSEHLLSHALDQLSARPRLHGLQVGVATYVVSLLQAQLPALPGQPSPGPLPPGSSPPGQGHARVADLLDGSGFFEVIAADPFSRAEWQRALELAPSIKQDFYTVLSTRDVRGEFARLLVEDPRLARCFVD